MSMYVELRSGSGSPIRSLADPSGGTFDAAGDFDRFIDNLDYPVLGSVDPYGDTTMSDAGMPPLIADIDAALPRAVEGPEARGLLRLRVLADRCQQDSTLHLTFVGD